MLSQDHRWLLAANAGSNDVTVFSVTDDGLQFRRQWIGSRLSNDTAKIGDGKCRNSE